MTDAPAEGAALCPSDRHRSTRITDRQASIVASAFRLFAERGYEQTTMTEIAEAAQVPRRSLFRYFESKDEIVFAAIDEEEGAFLRRRLRELALTSTPDSLKVAFTELARRQDAEPEAARTKIRLIFETPALSARMHDQVSRWQAGFEDALASDANARFARQVQVAAATAAYVVSIRKWADEGSGQLATWVEAAFSALDPRPEK